MLRFVPAASFVETLARFALQLCLGCREAASLGDKERSEGRSSFPEASQLATIAEIGIEVGKILGKAARVISHARRIYRFPRSTGSCIARDCQRLRNTRLDVSCDVCLRLAGLVRARVSEASEKRLFLNTWRKS
jgi:hypothetical protein